ncbi:hypothetical protein CLHOM_01870 [Clostridium homopropionicum DSM 5847]|uniref:Uncharacterized protein n=1 Tax=Clostridium homopropionicum DSM 5847 TaxID=1121318 RepID=A0A0L6ZEW5_9CLOT|nr:DUF2188 domain-containing protein [Clostridium homopropionicum]KOA21516.1 hypothetical protein CLHOM_01870 [Clostridium homopropionicum DSM 5847]SFG07136.1 hypothetical protein SAMN04488501_10534 [Clostridium homopropionicum]
MSDKYIYTIPNQSGGWDNIDNITGEIISHHRTKSNAIVKGRRQAKKREADYIIYNLDGKIGQRLVYVDTTLCRVEF